MVKKYTKHCVRVPDAVVRRQVAKVGVSVHYGLDEGSELILAW